MRPFQPPHIPSSPSRAQWIQKGKQRPNVELGHRLMIATVQNQLIQGYAVLMQEAEVERE